MITLFIYSCDRNETGTSLNDPVGFSGDFLLAVKLGEPYQAFLDTLSKVNPEDLSLKLRDDRSKTAFWINLYNALVQVKLQESGGTYVDRVFFFRKRDILFGTDSLSLDLIENGILRSKTDEYTPSLIDEFKVQVPDYRIHFALNCGAGACPPIAFYSSEQLNEQLEIAEEVFVQNDAVFDSLSNTVTVSEIFKWFKDDFQIAGGVEGLMFKHQIIPDTISPVIQYRPYDWQVNTDNYR